MIETRTDELMKINEVAERLRVATSSLYKMHKREHLPMFKVGRDWRCRQDDLEKWIEDRAQQCFK